MTGEWAGDEELEPGEWYVMSVGFGAEEPDTGKKGKRPEKREKGEGGGHVPGGGMPHLHDERVGP